MATAEQISQRARIACERSWCQTRRVQRHGQTRILWCSLGKGLECVARRKPRRTAYVSPLQKPQGGDDAAGRETAAYIGLRRSGLYSTGLYSMSR